ncbi:MAG: adenosylmethionine--8-amino-7-oxononanoate transaminase [Gammaproteobacteria bacterium]|nr:adenosylmethionine--8-amino-7-oxononanoate transaminase [Gammaproteobacteria bacterium]MDH3405664.1 adenosylmethionine--8-amino-7-oxononanoate transaminase [Gammaproteobacteria bacterium]MDH3563428.1 adenosylmethionine--8-amino-7-oxononanoate transaminase [Gammaproteobacteria bacterium]MDH5486255.1 adenosylmethionine--8-amino-7-oxononanoate transaminase [Gammaproteobacteria bacterium]
MDNDTLTQRDLKVLWHPCTQMRDHENLPLIPIRRGQGVWLEDFEGKRYLDAISSWWVNLFGHANPRINAAIEDQLRNLEHMILAGFTHEPVIRLSERLIGIAPQGLAHCFYASDGSAALEIALKMSFHYWQNCGENKRKRFISLANSYHGETLGALSVGDVALYKETYRPLLFEAITVKSPDCYFRESGESWENYSTRAFAEMEQALERHADETCAVVVEPLVQCAGSMRMYDPVYLKLLRQACDKHRVHLIADEIAVGFGRTGTMFACEQASVSPDFLCLGKGLTGGYLPLSVCLSREEIYQAFYADYTARKAFLHSHSYTGNPLSCRAALATLDIFDDDDVIERNKDLAVRLAQAAAPLAEHPHVAEVRQTGMILAIEMVKDKTTREPFPWQERRGLEVYRYALDQGLLLRPVGDVIYFMPPYVITPEEIDWLTKVAREGIERAGT